jgi:hypothetical protein
MRALILAAVFDVVCWAALAAYYAHFYFTHVCGA